MIEKPILRGEVLRPSTCGRTAVENDEMAFWQSLASRHGQRADVIHPVDLAALAQEIRRAWAIRQTNGEGEGCEPES